MIKILKNFIYIILSLSTFFLVIFFFKNKNPKPIKEVVINSCLIRLKFTYENEFASC